MEFERQWFALRVRPRSEHVVAESLRQKGYEEFLPLHLQRRRWSDRVKVVQVPLFPGYVFARFDVLHRLPILTTPGVLLVVSIGQVPRPIEDGEIDALKILVESKLQLEPWPYLEVGQRVRIIRGPLNGAEGIITAANRQRRLVISITLLQRSVSVEIPEDSAWPVFAERAVSRTA
ncbi:MAG: transcription termination/antitermination protein NusG [Vicinamibacterales bacterium]